MRSTAVPSSGRSRLLSRWSRGGSRFGLLLRFGSIWLNEGFGLLYEALDGAREGRERLNVRRTDTRLAEGTHEFMLIDQVLDVGPATDDLAAAG